MIKLKPIDNIGEWWKLWSIRFGALGTAITGYLVAFPDAAVHVWMFLPPDVRAMFPPEYVTFIGIFIFGLSLVSRLVKQEKLNRNRNGTD